MLGLTERFWNRVKMLSMSVDDMVGCGGMVGMVCMLVRCELWCTEAEGVRSVR